MDPKTSQAPASEAKVRWSQLNSCCTRTANEHSLVLSRISTHAQSRLNSQGISIPPFAYTSKPAPLFWNSVARSRTHPPRNKPAKTRLSPSDVQNESRPSSRTWHRCGVTRLRPVGRVCPFDRRSVGLTAGRPGMRCDAHIAEEQQRVLKDGSVVNRIRAPLWTAAPSPSPSAEVGGAAGRSLSIFTYARQTGVRLDGRKK
jgi:hypothetical protein